jgi:1-acyl-sn-glycerol-3-phosphate acyltransferase
MEKAEKPYRVSLWLKIRRAVLRLIFRLVFAYLYRVKITGMQNIPKDGAYIIAYNHISVVEPPMILTFWPVAPEALAGHDVWQRGWFGTVVDIYGATPVKRGEYDRQTIDTMMAQLEADLPLAIAPEGGRSHQIRMRAAHPGVAYLMGKAGVPIVPVAIKGTHDTSFEDARKGAKELLEMRIGKPFMLPPVEGKGAERREARQRNADEIMMRIAAMLPKEYHGYYEGRVTPSED